MGLRDDISLQRLRFEDDVGDPWVLKAGIKKIESDRGECLQRRAVPGSERYAREWKGAHNACDKR